MHNTPAPGAAEPGPPMAPADDPPQAGRRTTVVLVTALVLVVIMTGVLGTLAVLMTSNPDAPPLSRVVVKRLSQPIHFAPVLDVTGGPCQGTDVVPDTTGARCYQLAPGVTVTIVQKLEEVTESDGTYSIRVVLAPANREQIADLTRETVKQQLAVVVGDRVQTAPRVAQEITEDSLSIAGFTKPEADALLATLTTGVTAAPTQPTVQPTVQPTLQPTDQTQPRATQPGATQPGATQPGATQPGATQPGVTQPGATQPAPANENTRFSNCRDAYAAGYGPYTQGVHKQYDWYIDRDRDGIACERGDF